ncbi:hypothetical protein MASR1M59_23410 [Melaminivora sp.]
MTTRVQTITHPRQTLLAIAIGAALTPHHVAALDLMQSPPGTVQPYVAPNVIISLDDSTSMNTKDMIKVGNKWTKTRTEVLKDALKEVFSDTALVPDNKIRLAWQTLGNCTKVNNKKWAPPLGTTAATVTGVANPNVMRILDSTHRANFLKYADAFDPCTSTPTHFMVKRADEYMRAPLHKNGPWASKPGGTTAENTEFLGCRRNYHILLTDGDWNGEYDGSENINTTPINFDNQDSDTNINGSPKEGGTTRPVKTYPSFFLPDGTAYRRNDPQTWIYRDIDFPTWSSWHPGYDGQYISTLSDWTFKSWGHQLQDPTSLTGSISPPPEYDKAPSEETFTNRVSGRTVTLKKYWNPNYNPATWPHMVTFTIGFSAAALPTKQFRPVGNDSQWVGNIGKYWNSNLSKPLWNEDGPFQDTANGNSGLLIAPTNKLPYGYDGSFADYASGKAQWYAVKGGEAVEDMWHAAINGRGKFYAVEKGEDLKAAFRQIIQTINTNVEPDMTSTATSGSNVSRNNVGKYTGNYEPKNSWKGFVTADTVKTDGTTEPASGWGGKNTAQKLDAIAPTSRVIMSWSDKWELTEPKGGVAFRWATNESNLSTGQKLFLRKNAAGTDQGDSAGQDRLNYIRGERSKEGSDATGYPTSNPYRKRQSAQGDIVNSTVWYTGAPSSNYALKGYSKFTRDQKDRTPMIYVGGNDGMLHGFSAADGTEKIAYIPNAVIPNLTWLTDPTYNQKHRYFVDGSPMTGDIDMGTGIQDPDAPGYQPTYEPNWRSLLVGTLGAGGKGYFILDVTDPASFSESIASTLVKIDRTRNKDLPAPDCTLSTLSTVIKDACNKSVTEDRDIGHITARPVMDESNPMRTTQIARMNNNRWAVVLGNGYNSTNQRPVLLIQYLDAAPSGASTGSMGLLRIPATNDAPGSGLANDNGLSAPRLVDLNGDGRPDIAYAGDNQGNLWKFDLTSIDDTRWGIAFNGAPLFSALGGTQGSPDSRTLSQPITIAPTIRANDRKKIIGTGSSQKTINVGGVMVSFGTGRNVTKSDENNRNIQTLYSVLDNTRYNIINTTLGKRLAAHPGAGTCSPTPAADCIPAPTALGNVTHANLVQRSIEEVGGDAYGRVLSTTALDWNSHNGWYLDLPTVGERSLKPIEFFDGSNNMAVFTQVPAKGSDVVEDKESCESSSVDSERQYLTFINIMDGKQPSVQIIDKNNDGIYNKSSDDNVARMKIAAGPQNFIVPPGNKNIDLFNTKNEKKTFARMPEQSLRPSWRQIK